MNISKISIQIQKLASDNAPLILTTIGAAGTVVTALLTHKATLKAAHIIRLQEALKQSVDKAPLTGKEKVKYTWMCYIPPVASCTLTVGAIVMANRISMTRMAALAAAYSLTEKNFEEYREKIVEKLGKGKEQAARDELAQERFDRSLPKDSQIIMVGGGEILCFDQFTGRYFKSDMESIRRAENDTNFQILGSQYASLSDFYERIGLPATSLSEEVGWKDGQKLELKFSSVISPEGKPCISFDFDVSPMRNYGRCYNE